MTSIEQIARQYRGIRCNHIAQGLADLLRQAEANEVSYLAFAEVLGGRRTAAAQPAADRHEPTQGRLPGDKRLAESTTATRPPSPSARSASCWTSASSTSAPTWCSSPARGGQDPPGHGIGQEAIEAGYKVLFTTALALVEKLELAEIKGELKKQITALQKFDLLIIDELGYLPMNRQARYNLFQLVNALYEYRSVIITTNKDFTAWGEFFADDNVAVPIVDRLIHHSHIFMPGGESYRLKHKREELIFCRPGRVNFIGRKGVKIIGH